MSRERVAVFVDGFNLYHAINDLDAPSNHLKWVNLRTLAETYVPQSDFRLVAVKYFSAYATWRPGAYKRHRELIDALDSVGVQVVLGKFKEKDRFCFRCENRWKAHEEKETDVNIAIHLISDAYQNLFDVALLITADSDLTPAVRMLRSRTNKSVRIVFPIGLKSGELAAVAGGGGATRKMKRVHLERSLFPREVRDATGRTVAIRPSKYDPPATST